MGLSYWCRSTNRVAGFRTIGCAARWRAWSVAVIVAGQVVAITPLAGQGQSILAGAVVDTAGLALAGVELSVTFEPSGIQRAVRTDALGRFRAAVGRPEDNAAVVLARQVGYSPTLQRVALSAASPATIELVLIPTVLELTPLMVLERPPLPPGGNERQSSGGIAAEVGSQRLYLDDPSSADALFALVAGPESSGDSGIQVLGARADENSFLLNGMRFDGGFLPPDAVCGATFATTTSSPGRGDFAGGQLSMTACESRGFNEIVVRASYAGLPFAWNDQQGVSAVRRGVTLSGFASGNLRTSSISYRLSFQSRFNQPEAHGLGSASPDALADAGIAQDDLSELRRAAIEVGIPWSIPGQSQRPLHSRHSVALSASGTFGATGHLAGTVVASTDRRPRMPGFLQSETRRSTSRRDAMHLMLDYSSAVGSFVNRLSVAASTIRSASDAVTHLPRADVRMETESPGSGRSEATIGLGGSSPGTETASRFVEVRNEVSLARRIGGHALVIGQQLRLEGTERASVGQDLGTYEFQSLEELRVNRPSRLRRLVDGYDARGMGTNAAIWLGDLWRASQEVSVEGGVRWEHFSLDLSRAASGNPFVAGSPTTWSPNFSSWSPRLGLAWLVVRRDTIWQRNAEGQLIPAVLIDFNELSGNARGNRGSGTTLVAGIGAYRAALPLARSLSSGGLPVRTLTCIGDAVPPPIWQEPFASMPETCTDGAAESSPQFTVPPLYEAGYRSPIFWRANIGLNGVMIAGWNLDFALMASLGRDRESRSDLNLRTTPQFTIAAEAGREVLVRPEDIRDGTGFVEPGAGRLDPSFGLVPFARSGLRSELFQLHIGVSPPPLFRRLYLLFDYRFTTSRDELTGFALPTGVRLDESTWATGGMPTHSLVATTLTRLGPLRLGVRLTVQSGTPFTPLVNGDVNGDGRVNDRAFIPARYDASPSAEALDAVLPQFPGRIKQCLGRQRGQIAAPRSCRTDWTARLDLTLDLAAPASLGLSDRVRFTTRFLGAGAAMARLLGADPGLLRGDLPPDSRLLLVTGFNSGTRRFSYQVNERFGRRTDMLSGDRGYPPFQLQLGAEIALGPRRRSSVVDRLGLARGGRVGDAQELRAALRGHLGNPVDSILIRSAALALSAEQAGALQQLEVRFVAALDSIFQPVIDLSERGRHSTTDLQLGRAAMSALSNGYQVTLQYQRQALELLSEDQRIILRAQRMQDGHRREM